MISRAVARRYVGAAFERAGEPGAQATLERQLKLLQTAVEIVPDLPRLLKHPSVTLERKLEAVGVVLDEQLGGIVSDLVRLLVENDRVDALGVAGELCEEMSDQAAGAVHAFVTVAMPLADSQTERLAEALSQWFAAPVRLTVNVAPEMIGGIAVRVGDRLLDASLRGRLLSIRESLVA